jgi:hypothetical protein
LTFLVRRLRRFAHRVTPFNSTDLDSNRAYGTFAVRQKSLMSVREVTTEDQRT